MLPDITGVNCEIVPTTTPIPMPCDSDPCQNDGTCLDVDLETFNCTCEENYYGEVCEVFCEPLDDCDGHYECDDQGNEVRNILLNGLTKKRKQYSSENRVTFADVGSCRSKIIVLI